MLILYAFRKFILLILESVFSSWLIQMMELRDVWKYYRTPFCYSIRPHRDPPKPYKNGNMTKTLRKGRLSGTEQDIQNHKLISLHLCYLTAGKVKKLMLYCPDLNKNQS